MGRRAAGRNEQAQRILNLLKFLCEASRPHTVRELTDELYDGYKNRRTFYRDLQVLRWLQIPISEEERDETNEVAYRVPTMPSILRLAPTEPEILAMAVARNLVRAHLGDDLGKAYDAAWERIRKVLPRSLSDLATYVEAFFLARPPIGRSARLKPEILRDLARAVTSNLKCRLHYRPSDETAPRVHTFHPYFLVLVEGVLYVFGWSEERKHTRSLCVDRIARLEVLRERFERPKQFDFAELFPEDVFDRTFKAFLSSDREEEAETVVIEFRRPTARMIRERTWHPTQELEPAPGGAVRLRLRLPITEDLAGWIRSFGSQAQVIEPRALADRVRSDFEEAVHSYARQ